MKAKNRVNPHGIAYFLTELHALEGVAQTEIRTGWGPVMKRIVVPYDIERLSQAWYDWDYGRFVQDAFHFMNPTERQFLLEGSIQREKLPDWSCLYPTELAPGEVRYGDGSIQYEDGHTQLALPFEAVPNDDSDKGVGNE